MPANPVRYGVPNPSDPTVHDLAPVRFGAALVAVQVEMRRAEDGTWRGRLLFAGPSAAGPVGTREILFGGTENELWG